MFAAIVLSTMPINSMSWFKNDWCVSLNRLKEASSITAFTSPSNSAGQHDHVERRRLAQALS